MSVSSAVLAFGGMSESVPGVRALVDGPTPTLSATLASCRRVSDELSSNYGKQIWQVSVFPGHLDGAYFGITVHFTLCHRGDAYPKAKPFGVVMLN